MMRHRLLPQPSQACCDEFRDDEQRVIDGSADWRQWWKQHGERELRCILMSAWDPVGAAGGVPEAWDEYDRYLCGVAHRLRDTADREDAEQSVAAYLDHVERDFMGITPGRQNRDLAETLVAWHEWSFLRRGRPPPEWRHAV
jgi:hypothetical protein